MTSNQFHIQKEIQAKELNKILQSVKLNSFSAATKEKVTEFAEHAMSTIDEMRKEAYEKLEKFEYKPEKYDHSEERLQKFIEVIKKGKPLGKLQNSLLNIVGTLIGQVEKSQGDRITGENFSNMEKSPEYKEREKLLLQLLEDIKAAILLPVDEQPETENVEESATTVVEEIPPTEEEIMAGTMADEEIKEKGLENTPAVKKSIIDRLLGR